MTPLFINNKGEVPNGGWRYLQADTNFLVTAPSWSELVSKVKAHRKANNLPIGLEIDREIEQWLAEQLPKNFTTNQNPNRSAEVPRSDWPMWAVAISKLRVPEDKGVGTTIERVIGPFGGNAFKIWFAATFGQSCGCAERRDSFDRQYNYSVLDAAE